MEPKLLVDAAKDRIEMNRHLDGVLFHFKIHLECHRALKNSPKIRQGARGLFVGKDAKIISAKKKLVTELLFAKFSLPSTELTKFPIDRPIWCMFHFYFADFYTKPKRKSDNPRMSMTLGDLSNLYQLPEDALEEAGIIANDALIVSHDLSRKLPSPDGTNYLEIFILEGDCG